MSATNSAKLHKVVFEILCLQKIHYTQRDGHTQPSTFPSAALQLVTGNYRGLPLTGQLTNLLRVQYIVWYGTVCICQMLTYRCLRLMQIYNEMIRDLLNPGSGFLDLREDQKGVQVAGLSERSAASTDQVSGLLWRCLMLWLHVK